MFDALIERGFQIEFHSHARAILGVDFPRVAHELEQALLAQSIPMAEIIGSGGGETKGTQRLRHALNALNWPKYSFTVEKIINGVRRESISHEIDHVRSLPNGTRVALEIEWNNKDPFYDRDLENFKRLHADGAISVGIIITRGLSLHDNMRALVRRFLDLYDIDDFAALDAWNCTRTPKQKQAIQDRISRAAKPMSFREAFTDNFVADKFGEASTHWRKLEARIQRGVGNPCPLLLIGLPDSIVSFDPRDNELARQDELDL